MCERVKVFMLKECRQKGLFDDCCYEGKMKR